mmetsp:Transcript_21948/g.66704  ORF Transcript_21948/g.66704 Transcript_21948/m.66704 type:complete len:95 (-) Transcript_21948:522-806(-)
MVDTCWEFTTLVTTETTTIEDLHPLHCACCHAVVKLNGGSFCVQTFTVTKTQDVRSQSMNRCAEPLPRHPPSYGVCSISLRRLHFPSLELAIDN